MQEPGEPREIKYPADQTTRRQRSTVLQQLCAERDILCKDLTSVLGRIKYLEQNPDFAMQLDKWNQSNF